MCILAITSASVDACAGAWSLVEPACGVMITLLPPEVTCTQTHARACSVQYYVACKGLNVTATIHTAHAQKHFSPETKSKVRPKKKFARLGTVDRAPPFHALQPDFTGSYVVCFVG